MSRRAIFVDTSAWYALQVTDDQLHPATVAVFPKILDRYETLVTSNHVVGETYTLLRTARGFREAWRFVDALGTSPRVEVRVTSGALEEDAYSLLREVSDQPLSFVDGISLCVMRQEKIQHAFAFDFITPSREELGATHVADFVQLANPGVLVGRWWAAKRTSW